MTSSKSWDWTFKLIVGVDMGEVFNLTAAGLIAQNPISYAVSFEVAKLPKDYNGVEGGAQYLDAKEKSKVLKVSYGEMVADTFCPWPQAVIYIAKDIDRLCKASQWKPLPAPNDLGVLEEDECVAASKFTFRDCADQSNPGSTVLAVFVPGQKKESGKYQKLCNFRIDRVVDIFQFDDRERGVPIWRLRVECDVDQDGAHVVHVTPEYNPIMPDSVRMISGEVNIPLAEVQDRELPAFFNKISSSFVMERSFKVEHLVSLISQKQPWPTAKRIAPHFGRQIKATSAQGEREYSKLFIYGNVCYEDGIIFTHEEKNIAVLPAMFGSNPITSLSVFEFPTICLVPQPWVRFAFFVDMWRDTYPRMFHNNVMSAKATFALGVAMLHTTDFTGGKMGGEGMAVGYLLGPGNTGKTKAAAVVNAFAGFNAKGMMHGNQSSTPKWCHRMAAIQCCTPLLVDEVYSKKQKFEEDRSGKLKDLTHLVFNGTSRDVVGKSDRVFTSFIGTANQLVNEDDDAFLQRLALITWKPLVVKKKESTEFDEDWLATKKLVSALQPDFEQFIWEGTIDKIAIRDCCDFINECSGVTYSRSANVWGCVLYYMILLEVVAQGQLYEIDQIFEWVCCQSARQEYMSTRHSSSLDQLVLGIDQVLKVSASSSRGEDLCFHWHNWRTTERPEGIAQLSSTRFYAVRVEAACNVIYKVLRIRIKPEDVARDVANHTDFATFSRGRFWNIAHNGFPIVKSVMDEETCKSRDVPLPEDELVDDDLLRQRALFFRQDKFKELVEDAQGPMTDYKAVVIQSAFQGYGAYNFYETVRRQTLSGEELPTRWYGLRAIESMPFAPMCGITNDASVRSYDLPEWEANDGHEEMTQEELGMSVKQCFRPRNIAKYYNTRNTPFNDDLPPPFREDPFIYRNHPYNDDPMPSKTPCVPISTYSPTKKQRRDDQRSGNVHGGDGHRILSENNGRPVRDDQSVESVRAPPSHPHPCTLPSGTPLLQAGDDVFDDDRSGEESADSEDRAWIDDEEDGENDPPGLYYRDD